MHTCLTPLPKENHSVSSYSVLTVASWPQHRPIYIKDLVPTFGSVLAALRQVTSGRQQGWWKQCDIFGVRQTRLWMLVLKHGWTLGKQCHLWEFGSGWEEEMQTEMTSTHRVVCEIKWDHLCKSFNMIPDTSLVLHTYPSFHKKRSSTNSSAMVNESLKFSPLLAEALFPIWQSPAITAHLFLDASWSQESWGCEARTWFIGWEKTTSFREALADMKVVGSTVPPNRHSAAFP